MRLEHYPSNAHVFHVFWSFLPEAVDALTKAGDFIRGTLPTQQATAGRIG